MRCKRCNAEANNQVLTPEGPHYGKVVCAVCGTFLTWLPTPYRAPDMTKVPVCNPQDNLPPLKGAVSERQRDYAMNMRAMLIHKAESRLDPVLFAAMRQIQDAGFWMGNKDRAVTELRWPKEWVQNG